MELNGKIINFLGDSITAGSGTTGPAARYVTLLGERLGLKRANNYGIGGTRIARQQKPYNPVFDSGDYCRRCTEMDPEADVIFVFGGTNDYGHGDAPIGTFADRTPETFYGACHYVMRTILETYPSAVTVIATPLHRLGEDNPSQANGLPLSAYVNMIKEVAAYYALPVLDLWSMSGMQPQVDVIREKYMPDGLHPNDAGNVLLADRIEGFLKAL